MAVTVTMETVSLEGCSHVDASMWVCGILGLPGPLPFLPRKEGSVNEELPLCVVVERGRDEWVKLYWSSNMKQLLM